MPVVYWTASKICERLGWSPRSAGRLPGFIKKYGIPAFLRVDPHNKFKRTYYSSESALTAWELVNAKHYRERLLAEQDEQRGKA